MRATRQMTRRRTARATARLGFTLTELLIVMAILVLLVSLVGPRILGSKKKADINSVKTQIGLFEASLERYAVDLNTFPGTEEGLEALVRRPAENEEGSGRTSNWDGPYLKKSELPLDPWGGQYQYEYPPTHGTDDQPDIWSYGPDGTEGTEDDIVSWSQRATGEPGDFPEDDMPAMPDMPREPALEPQ